MNELKIVTDPIELIAGTSNMTSPAYVETAKNIDSADPKKSQDYLNSFLLSIDKVASRGGVSDSRIVASKGNISAFKGYPSIKSGLVALNKIGSTDILKNLEDILKGLEIHQSSYVAGYTTNNRIIMLEYETAVYMLVTGLSFTIANNVEVVETKTGILFKKKSGTSKGVISKTVRDLAKQLNSPGHGDYLKELIDIKSPKEDFETAITREPVVENVAIIQGICRSLGAISQLWPTIKRLGIGIYRSMFGILPLIRAILYLHYKRKADTILELERQVHFIQMNIEQLQNIQSMDPAKKQIVIQKQQAYIDAYKKRAEKLRAQLIETENDTSAALAYDKSDVKGEPATVGPGNDPDFML